MTQEIINRLKELLAQATPLENWQEIFDTLDLTPGDAYPRLLSALATNLTPSGVERLRRASLRMLAAVRGAAGGTWVGAVNEAAELEAALALPSEPPSQGDVEGRARELVEAYDKARRALEYSNPQWKSHQATWEQVEKTRNALLAALASKEDARS